MTGSYTVQNHEAFTTMYILVLQDTISKKRKKEKKEKWGGKRLNKGTRENHEKDENFDFKEAKDKLNGGTSNDGERF